MFTVNERKILELFCTATASATNSRFIRTFLDQPHHILIGKLPDGRIVDEYPRYDDDDLRAFLTHYRKLRANSELTQLNRIMNLLRRKGVEVDRPLLDSLRNEIKEEGQSWWGSFRPDEGYTAVLTQERLEDLILNGEVFHWDDQKRNALAQVLGKTPFPKAVALLNYMRFARTVLYCAQTTAALIIERGYIARASAPSAPQTSAESTNAPRSGAP